MLNQVQHDFNNKSPKILNICVISVLFKTENKLFNYNKYWNLCFRKRPLNPRFLTSVPKLEEKINEIS